MEREEQSLTNKSYPLREDVLIEPIHYKTGYLSVPKAKIVCPNCGHKWNGTLREHYTCLKCRYAWRIPERAWNKKAEQLWQDGAVRYDKCLGEFCDGEYDWLYKWEGEKPWCEGCIDEAHARIREAEDAMVMHPDPLEEEF